MRVPLTNSVYHAPDGRKSRRCANLHGDWQPVHGDCRCFARVSNVRDALRISQCIRPCSGSAKRGATSTITRNIVAVAPPPPISFWRTPASRPRASPRNRALDAALPGRRGRPTIPKACFGLGERCTARSGRRSLRPRLLLLEGFPVVDRSSRSVTALRPSPGRPQPAHPLAPSHRPPIALPILGRIGPRPDRTGPLRRLLPLPHPEPRPSPDISTTRQRRFIRPASLAGVSFLLERRGIAAKYSPCPTPDRVGQDGVQAQPAGAIQCIFP